MLFFKSVFYTSFSLLMLVGLSACSSVVETPNQEVTIITPGATDSRCSVHIGDSVYQAEPPQTFIVRKTHNPMDVRCTAAGNRSKQLVIKPEVSDMTYGNVANAGVGAAYDLASGAMFKYPEQIVVDFTGTVAQAYALPSYHSLDSKVSGQKYPIEHMGAEILETRTSYERSNRRGWVEEKERRMSGTKYGYKEESSSVPELVSPYFPEPTFPGTTSF